MKGAALRALDRVAGVPVLVLLGALRRRRTRRDEPARIGVLKTRGVGDAILGSVLTAGLKAAYPRSEVVLFGEGAVASIANLLPGVARGVAIDPYSLMDSVGKMRRERLDMLVDLGAWPRMDALISALSGASHTVGFRTDGQARHFAYDAVVQHSSRVHEVRNYLALLQGVTGQGAIEISPRLTAPSTRGAQVTEAMQSLAGQDYCVLHPWAGGSNPGPREWPSVHWHRLMAWLRTHGLGVVLTGAKADRDASHALLTSLPDELRSDPAILDLSGRLPLPDMYWLLEQATAVVSVNTGIMHMSAAMGRPTVALHGPTNPERWGPIGARAVVVSPDVEGCGYLDLGFEYHGQRQDCMRHVDPAAVEAVIKPFLTPTKL